MVIYSLDALKKSSKNKATKTKKEIVEVLQRVDTIHVGFLVITNAQLHSKEHELRFCAGSYPTRSVSEICGGEDFSLPL